MATRVLGQVGRNDPVRGYKYRVTIPGFGSAGFTRVAGLKINIEVAEYREGTDPSTPRKLPGRATFDNITLERGQTYDMDMVIWLSQIYMKIAGVGLSVLAPSGATGSLFESIGLAPGPDGFSVNDIDLRKDFNIELLDRPGNIVRRWIVRDAFPVSLEFGEMNAGETAVPMQTLELAHEGWNIVPA